jgi:tRNA-dihydrouridine synthase
MATGETLPPPTLEERIAACRKHVRGSVQWKGEKLGLLEMRRHYANYLKNLSHVKEFRMRLVSTLDLSEIESILDELILCYPAVPA